jgi:uridine kinase
VSWAFVSNQMYRWLLSPSAPVTAGGYYCLVRARANFSGDELAALEARMQAIVEADDPIIKRTVTLKQAVEIYDRRKVIPKLRLLEQRTRNDLNMYTLRGYSDYFFGYMLPSTGFLRLFRLAQTNTGGFILQYPQSDTPTVLAPTVDNQGKLCAVFDRTEQLLTRLEIEDIGQLNALVRAGRVQEQILVAEAIHEQQIADIARQITEAYQSRGMRLVMIAGPSSSGKTTFSKRLAIQLLAFGLKPFTLELDNYFVDRELTPRDAQGNYDFEALETVNLALFNRHLGQLVAGEQVTLPRFNFKLGKSMEGPTVQLQNNHVLVIEGIHGINPRLVTSLPQDAVFRIYVSALTVLNIDPHNRIATTDVRLLRRICRDAVSRGHNAQATISQWPSVRSGEKKNIFPFQEHADYIFNSSLTYELAALRPIAEPLLLQVETSSKAHIEANRLLSFLRWVAPFTPDQRGQIPDTSLLREFIGGSILEAYHPGGT